MWLGLGVNALSGVVLLIAYPAKALTNPVFYVKLLLVVLGVYAAQRINRVVFPGGVAVTEAVTIATKRWAAISIVTWAGTVLTGRLLAYTNHVLFAYELS
jgi:type IV secretory pathway TrbL component